MGWRVTRRFDACNEEGRRYIIVQLENGDQIDYILETGWAVTLQSDGSFRIDDTGEILRIEVV